MERLKKKVLFPLITITVSVCLIEVVLQVVSFAAPKKYNSMLGISQVPIFVKDDRLVLRPNPDFPEHDDRGFRNQSTSGPIAIVALGDSQTYGTGVKREEAWPQQLGQLGSEKVYNMACGGWGPTQSLLLFDDAISLKPRLIIEAFYSGNDMYDSFSNVYYDGQLPELKTKDEKESGRIREAEQKETVHDKVMRLYKQGGATDVFAAPTTVEPTSRSMRVRKFLGDHIRLYQLFAVLKQNLRANNSNQTGWESDKRLAETGSDKDFYQVFEGEKLRTIFTPELRLVALDSNDPRIVEGHRIGLEAIRVMSQKAKAAQIQFEVVLIPTKELVYKDAAYAAVAPRSKSYRALLENEELLRQKTISFLAREDIKTIDALPALAARVKNGAAPYPESPDGHPNPEGHRAIAEVALAELKRQNLWSR